MDDFQTNLQKLAELSIRFGVNLQPGQELFISAPSEALDLVRLLTAEAYRAGAVAVIPLLSDDAMTLARYEHGSDAAIDHAPGWLYRSLADRLQTGQMARLAVSGETPGLLSGQDPDRIARSTRAQSTAMKPFKDAIISGSTNWNIIPYVTPGWAAKVFPDDAPEVAVRKLWALVFRAARIDQADPVAAWRDNFAELKRREGVMNAHAFDALHFTGGGTDLTVGLAHGHRWLGGGDRLESGLVYAPNLPTEEIFTMPDRNRTQGRAVFTKPAAIAGAIVDGLEVEFAGGKAVSITARSGQELARDYFATDEGASRLGEVALVAQSSPIAQTGAVFFNTLFDENAACHIAFGSAYQINLAKGADAQKAGMNKSQIHMDCMIGHDRMDVDGITDAGDRVAVMRAGEFVI